MTFGILACETNHNDVNLKDEAVKCILQALELNTNDMALEEVLCSAVASLSDDADKCRLLVKEGGVCFMRNALKMFPQSSTATHSCLYFLENASKEDAGMWFCIHII